MPHGFNMQRMPALAPHLLNLKKNPQPKRKQKEKKELLSLWGEGRMILNS